MSKENPIITPKANEDGKTLLARAQEEARRLGKPVTIVLGSQHCVVNP
jgi:hypothetical protein